MKKNKKNKKHKSKKDETSSESGYESESDEIPLNSDEEEEIEEVIENPMDDSCIREYLPDAKIVTYPNLKKFQSLEQLLPKQTDYVIILYLDSPSSGHWTALSRSGDKQDNGYEFYDSYGGEPDNCLTWTSPEKLKQLGIDEPYLTNLLNKTNKNVIYNPIKYQEENKKDLDVNTCGRHCCYRILQLVGKGRKLPQYYDMMKKLKDKTGLNYDQLVSVLINQES